MAVPSFRKKPSGKLNARIPQEKTTLKSHLLKEALNLYCACWKKPSSYFPQNFIINIYFHLKSTGIEELKYYIIII